MAKPQRRRRRSVNTANSKSAGVLSHGHSAPLGYWVAITSDIPLLSHDDEIALARRSREGDRVAFAKLVQSNLRLVIRIASRYAHPNVPLADLVQEGNIGLIQATERFDPEKGFRFSTYAVWWIRRAVLRALSYDSRHIRLPEHIVAATTKLERATNGMTQELDREPDVDELAEALETTPEQIRFLQSISYDFVSVDASLSQTGSITIGESLEDPRQRPERWLRRMTDAEALERLLSVLPVRDQEILRTRFGIGGGRPRTLKETGEQFQLTRERIRQIEKQALNQLRQAWTHPSDSELNEIAS